MTHDEIVRLVIWTMEYYGSDAGDKALPGSKLRSQAEHIADVAGQIMEADRRLDGLSHISPSVFLHDVDMTKYPLPK